MKVKCWPVPDQTPTGELAATGRSRCVPDHPGTREATLPSFGAPVNPPTPVPSRLQQRWRPTETPNGTTFTRPRAPLRTEASRPTGARAGTGPRARPRSPAAPASWQRGTAFGPGADSQSSASLGSFTDPSPGVSPSIVELHWRGPSAISSRALATRCPWRSTVCDSGARVGSPCRMVCAVSSVPAGANASRSSIAMPTTRPAVGRNSPRALAAEPQPQQELPAGVRRPS